jgi:DNA/RNA-binding domain of Phe-tRNA-synthetase-like protein
MRVQLQADFLDLFPRASVAVLVCRGMDNSSGRPSVTELVDRLERGAAQHPFTGTLADHPHVAAWRAAYRAFGTNPRSHPVSFEALVKRFAKSGELPRISPAVDVYNVVSVRSMLPVGGYDLDTLAGDVVLTRARGGEVFEPIGRDPQPEEVTAGEVIYRDDARVLTRRWNHRDSIVSAITERTRNAAFFLESPDRDVIAEEALSTAAETLREYVDAACSGRFRIEMLAAERPSTELAAVVR